MDGDLDVRSEVGAGSTFRFHIVADLAQAQDVEVEESSRRVIGLEPGQPTYRLLIVEDKDANRKLLVKLLRPLGFEVREAVNGREALALWETWHPDLIWMDTRMPVMDGHEATKYIKAQPAGDATVIIALTASAFEEDRQTILAEGCDDFVRKPFRETEIFDRLTRHLGVRFVYDEMQAPVTTGVADAADVLTPAAMQTLPADWLVALQSAALQADTDVVFGLLDQIRESHPRMADALENLAYNFRFDMIMELTTF
jgi:CheY-like chemotaxis protein